MGQGHHTQRFDPWRPLVLVVFIAAGFLFVSSASTADGSDLRPAGTTLASLLRDHTEQLAADQVLLTELNEQVERLSSTSAGESTEEYRERAAALEGPAGLAESSGPGLQVVLDDAPRGSAVPGLDPNALVVHQQDLQAFVNALWAGGAQAISLQGQRLISTTGIKCVGSTVVLDGVPYTPPYVIEAVGDPTLLEAALDASPSVQIYRRYVEQFELGLQIESRALVEVPAYGGTVGLRHASLLEE